MGAILRFRGMDSSFGAQMVLGKAVLPCSCLDSRALSKNYVAVNLKTPPVSVAAQPRSLYPTRDAPHFDTPIRWKCPFSYHQFFFYSSYAVCFLCCLSTNRRWLGRSDRLADCGWRPPQLLLREQLLASGAPSWCWPGRLSCRTGRLVFGRERSRGLGR